MTQYKRITGKVFGGNATATGNDPQIAQFGSALAGTFIGTTDPQTIQQLPAWGEGWSGAVTPETQFPPMPEMTGAMKVLSHQICGILQQGVSTWDSATIYYTGNFCSKNGAVYVSLTDENQGNDPVSDTANWRSYGGANLDLSNLSAVGEKHFLNKTQITNCLLEVPQNIKLELNNGLLTLKKGSIVIVPTGTVDRTSEYPVGARFLNDNLKVHHTQFVDGKFTVWAQTQNDITYYEPTPTKVTDKYLLYLRIDNCSLFRRATEPQSGTSVPSGFNSVYYNTNTNYCKTYNSSNSTEYYSSLPLGRVSSNTNATNNISKIDSVYNGFGEIGSFSWHDKGVKWIAPDGRNEDGTLKNVEIVTKFFVGRVNPIGANLGFWRIERILSSNYEAIVDMQIGHYFEQEDEPNATYAIWYKPSENIMRYRGSSSTNWEKRYTIPVIQSTANTNNNLLTFEPKQTFRAVDYSDKKEITGWSMPSAKYTDLALGESGTKYTAPADGLFFLNMQWGTGTYLAGLVSENNDSVHLYGYQLDTKDSRSSDGYAAFSIPIKKGMVCQINYNCNGSFKVFRFVYAKGAI